MGEIVRYMRRAYIARTPEAYPVEPGPCSWLEFSYDGDTWFKAGATQAAGYWWEFHEADPPQLTEEEIDPC